MVDPAVGLWIKQDALAALFDPRGQLQYIGQIFDRLGLDDGENESGQTERQATGI